MALPQSQYCRVIHRRLRSPCDSAWIPDSALASAFEQFCSVSRVTSRRNGSNVPGPLENRRRLGKRHMGELNFGHMNAPPPFWEIANAVDLTQWKWAPPTTFENRRAQQDESDPQPFLASIQNWLGMPSYPSDSPLATASPDGNRNAFPPEVVAMEAVAPASIPDTVRTLERVTTPPMRQMPSDLLNDILHDVDALTEQGLSAMFSTTSTSGLAKQNVQLDIFCDRLKIGIAQESVSRDALRIFLRRITKEVYGLASKSNVALSGKQASGLLVRVYTAVIDGLCVDSGLRSGHFDHFHNVYSTLLSTVARLEINNLRLFQRIMANIPADCVWRCNNEIVLNIQSFLVALSRPAITSHRIVEGKERSSIVRQVNKMAGCLKSLSSETSFHRDIMDRITKCLSSEQGAGADGREVAEHELMRFCWLHLLARLPQVGTKYLAEACNLLDSNSSIEPLAQRQICEFFLANISSRYSVKEKPVLYELLKTSSESGCYATVGTKLWKTGQHRYVKVLADLLLHLGRQQDIKHIVHGLRNSVDNESKPLANLAIGVGHPQLALWVYIRYHQSRWKAKNFYNTAFAQETLNKLLEFKEMKSEKILDALRIYPSRRQRHSQSSPSDMAPTGELRHLAGGRRPPRSMLSQRRVRQTEKAAAAIAGARYVSNRTALARITRCIKFLQSHNTPIPPPVLRSLFHIVTRDLAAGRPGRTTRLRWFLKLLLKETNTSNVLEVGLALKKWRGLVCPVK